MLSPRQTAALLGISESSVKRWVDRGRIQAERTAGGHRRISLPEVARFVRAEGLPVVRPDIIGLGDHGALPEEDRGPAREGQAEEGDPRSQFFQALMEGRPEWARRLMVAEFLAGRSIARLVDEVLAPGLRQVGGLWGCRSDGIFLEHRAVGICETALEAVRALMFRPGPQAPVAVGGAPAHDPYTLPSELAATVVQAEGWQATDLGAFTPPDVLADAARREDARLVWLAVSSAPGPEAARGEIADLAEELRKGGWQGAVAVGGPACQELHAGLPEGVRLVPAMVELGALARGAGEPLRPLNGGSGNNY